MGLNSTFVTPEETITGAQPVQRPPSDFGQLFQLKYQEVQDNFRTDSRGRLMREEREKNLRAAEKIFGRKLKPEDAKNFTKVEPKFSIKEGVVANREEIRKNNEFFLGEALRELKESDPNAYKNVKTFNDADEDARKRARMSALEWAEASKRGSGFDSTVAGFLGGFSGTASDPVNLAVTGLSLAAAPFTGGTSLAAGQTIARQVVSTALKEAAINAGAELLSQPVVAGWQRELGNEYGFSEIAENVGFAALFGGAVGGVTKGTIPSATWLFSKMSNLPNVGKRFRVAANYLQRVAHIRESIPFIRDRNSSNTSKHLQSVEVANDSLATGQKIDSTQMKVSEADFQAIDTTSKPGDSARVKETLQEIERFKKDSPVEELSINQVDEAKPTFDLQTLPQQILDKAQAKKGGLRVNDFAPEELDMMKSAGIEPTKKGKIVKDSLVNERNRRQKDGELQDMGGKEADHINTYNRTLSDRLTTNQDLDKNVKRIQDSINENELATGQGDVVDNELADQFNKNYNSPETIAAEQKTFDDLLNDKPDLEITFEDGTVRTMRELSEEFAEDQRVLNEVIDCGLAQ